MLGFSLLSTKLIPLLNRPEPVLVANESTVLGKKIKVDVSGEVLNPGVYELDEGGRIEDAIYVAGGMTEGVDKDWVYKNLNLAQKLIDGTKVYLPNKNRLENSSTTIMGVTTNQNSININTASFEELDKLIGVGPVTVQKIIENRPYQNIEELKTKKVVSNSVFEKIKNNISVY